MFSAAAAQRTTRIRLGALLFLLPLYHPLRLLEELCMLDHLSNGRLDIGVGRGISPYEFGSFGVDLEESGDAFDEVLDLLYKGFARERIDHDGNRFKFRDVPVPMRPLQRPYPPFWYGLRGGDHASLLPGAPRHERRHAWFRRARRPNIARFRKHGNRRPKTRRAFGSPVVGPLVGLMRAMFIADSDKEAERHARPAYHQWADNLMWLWKDKGGVSPLPIPLEYDKAIAARTLVVGSPETVRRELVRQAECCGHNYVVLQLAFGGLTHERRCDRSTCSAPR